TEAYSQSHVPDVPTIEYLPHRPVPALTREYASDGQQAVDQTIRPLPSRSQKHVQPPHEAAAPNSPSIPAAGVTKQANNRTVNLSVKLPVPRNDTKTAIPPAEINDRIDEVEAQLKPSAERLLKAVNEKVEGSGTSPRKRKSYLDIFNATVPDPEDIGLMTNVSL
ncbi:type IV secretory system conjugative DNA transfer family protein, partial [Brucella anthropi]|nr:type IV secretory system conjugative DNA transfer family protein [Brucella anthropi]